MSRRLLAGGLALAGVALVVVAGVRLLGGPAGGGNRSLAALPNANLLLVTLDTTRADALGVYGAEGDPTPNLDRLAGEGITFLAAQAPAPITLVAHASILTGRYPYRHGVRNNGMFVLPAEVPTLATVLADRGWRTGAFVSAYVLARRYGLDRGFGVYDDDLSRGRHEAANVVPSRRAEITVEPALDWLAGLGDGERFFCWIHFYDPHAPYDPPDEFRRRFPTDPYTGEVAYMDDVIGRLLEALEERGLRDRTVIAVIGDHGEALGEHGEQTHALLLHQATTRVPWLLAGPRIPPGLEVAAPVSAVDLAPTVCALLGVPAPSGMDGVSLAELPLGRADEGPDRAIYSETMLPRFQYGWSPLRGLRRGRWQLVSGVEDQLFDLRADPRELADLSDREGATVSALAGELDRVATLEQDPALAAARTEVGRDELERLQALGYLGSEASPRPDPPDPRDLIEAHVHTERARGLAALGRAEEALGELQVMLDLDPGNTSALALRAQLLGQVGRRDEARQTLERMLALDPESAQAYRQLAMLELVSGDAERALALARLGAGRRGAFGELAVIEASALVALGRLTEAVDLLDARLAERPDDADLLAARAGLHGAAGDRAAAERLLRQAVATDALHLRARLALAELLSLEQRTDEAVALLEELLRIDPGHPEALARIGTLRLDDPERARPYLEEAVRLQPSRHDYLLRLGVCYVRLGDHRRGEATLRRGLELAPEDPDLQSNLAVPLMLEGRLEEAERLLRSALAKRPGFAEAGNNLALCLMYQRRLEEAEAEVRAVLEQAPERRDARLTLCSILAETGRHDQAAEVLEEMRQEQPADPELGARLGVALEAAGRPAEALPLLWAALPSFRGNQQVVRALARAEEAAGDPAEASRQWAALAQAAPPGELRSEATAALERLALERR